MSVPGAVFSLLSPAGGRARLSTLIFHRVLPESDPLREGEPTAREFETLMARLARKFRFLPLDEALARMRAGTLPDRAMAVTFDDGYADNLEIATPILARLGIPATFFVATGFLDGGRMWNDSIIETVRRATSPLDLAELGLGVHDVGSIEGRNACVHGLLSALKHLGLEERSARVAQVVERAKGPLPDDLMMTSGQVRALARSGMTIGAHTVNHPILASIPIAAARDEIARGRDRLQEIVGSPIRLFAYPNGRPGTDYRHEHVALVRDLGFTGAVSTAYGAGTTASDVFQVPRFTPWRRDALGFDLHLARNIVANRAAIA